MLLPTNWKRFGPGQLQPRFETRIQRAGDPPPLPGNPFYFPEGSDDTVALLEPGRVYRARRANIGFERPGEYTLTASLSSDGSYQIPATPRQYPPRYAPGTCWAGRLDSTPLVIKISAPEREDDVAALNLLRAAPNGGQYSPMRVFAEQDEAVFRKVVELYPRSIYARHCRYVLGCSYAGAYRHHHDPEDLTRAGEYLGAVIGFGKPREPFYLRDDAIEKLAEVELEAARHHGSIARGLLEKIAREEPDSDRFDEVLQLWPQVTVFPRSGPYPPPTALPLPVTAHPTISPTPPAATPPVQSPPPSGYGPAALAAAFLSGLLLAALGFRLARRRWAGIGVKP